MSLKAAFRWFWYVSVKNKKIKNIIFIYFQVNFLLKALHYIIKYIFRSCTRTTLCNGGFGSTSEGILVDDTKNIVKWLYHIAVGQNQKCTNCNK
jgi:hypothetical protein